MPLNKYERFCYDRFGRASERKAGTKLKTSLESAHIHMRGGAYLAYIWLTTILVLVVTLIVFATLTFLILPLLGVVLDLGFIILSYKDSI